MEQSFQQMVLGKTGYPDAKNEVGSLSYIQKWKSIKDLNVRPQTMKILEENRDQSIQNNLIYDTKFWQWFLSLTPKTQVPL